jgi:hypothetical protein
MLAGTTLVGGIDSVPPPSYILAKLYYLLSNPAAAVKSSKISKMYE